MSGNPLLELMRQGESGAAGYNAYNRGTYVGADGKEHIRAADRPIDMSKLTLGQVQQLQHAPRRDPERLFAVGKYQIIPETMDAGVRTLKFDPNQRFSPSLQDKIFSEYLIVGKRPAIHNYIVGKSDSLHAAQKGLAMEWASFGDPDKNGRSYYGGANKASITLSQSADALNQMRTDYKVHIDKGMFPDAAWKMVTISAQAPEQSQTHPQHRPQVAPAPKHANAIVDGVLREGERGPDVRGLQHSLNKLGYRDAQGRPLAEDSDYGQRTKEAVEAFQRANGLKVDGLAGPDTVQSIGKHLPNGKVTATAEITGGVTVANPTHPDHALFKESLDGLKNLDPHKLGFRSEQQYQNAAASLTFEAKVSGLKQIDHVVLSTNGTGLFAVQGRMDDPAHHRIYTDKAQAASQPVEQSTLQIAQEIQNRPPIPHQEAPERRTMILQ